MTALHEVPNPIINSPYAEPAWHYDIQPGVPAHKEPGRRPAMYYYRPANAAPGDAVGEAVELPLVNDLRARVGAWRQAGYPGATRTTDELLRYWGRPERERKLFFCQREAAETVIFLFEARADLRQGLDVSRDEPGAEARLNGYSGFARYACKMATGSGKTTVMGMLAAWSLLNKVNDRGDARFSDVALVVCPNLTIRDRLAELDPQLGERSLYRTRDLVPPHLMDSLRRGKVIVLNWQQLQPQELGQVGGVGARVVQRGPESDTALVQRVLGKRIGGKGNILVFNDEAHHAYRLRPAEVEDEPAPLPGAEDEAATAESEEDEVVSAKEATVWVEGLDKINKLRGINACIDLSATPYYLNNTGNDPGRPFPWVVSDFGLVDAIESGLVKIPQLPIQDPTGAETAAYFNIWKWIVEKRLTRAERGGRRGQISPKAVVKYAHTPIAQLAGSWRETFLEWQADPAGHPTPPVFIVVCRDTRLAKVLYDWIGRGDSDVAAPIEEFVNRGGQEYTVRVDSRVVEDLEAGKSVESQRLRFVLQTIGKTQWPGGQPPAEWLELAKKLEVADPAIPPGRDVRCIISVAMLTEGWDATTVTHIIGLRPFQSQLLCEQVVGRGLRRSRYDVLDVERPEDIPEEMAKVYGVPFEVIPFKQAPRGQPRPPARVEHVYALPERAHLAIMFPRVEGYAFAIKSRVQVSWDSVPALTLDPLNIPPETTLKGLSWAAGERPTLAGPGRLDRVTLENWRKQYRLQQLEFDLAKTLTRAYADMPECEVPVHALFAQLVPVVQRYIREKVEVRAGYDRRDVFLNPYFDWMVETLRQNLRPDVAGGEAPEMPRMEKGRETGSTAEADFWTSRPVQEVTRSHLNYVVADTRQWEQSTAYYLDNHPNVLAFVKNAGMGFAIPYLHSGEKHEYVPDYLVRLERDGRELGTLILEMKGPDNLAQVKRAAAERWVSAVNADGRFGTWRYQVIYDPAKTTEAITKIVENWA
jgi:type III restriction enzyme